MPTTCEMSKVVVARASPIGTSPATTAASRKSFTRPGNRSVESTPAAATTSPDEVDRKAAMAPAATSAPSATAGGPVSAAAGSRSRLESDSPGAGTPT